MENSDEALKLINLKKYNKIILITNGKNNCEQFIKKAREIIGANTIVAISTLNEGSKVDLIKSLKNVIILNGIGIHIKFFKSLKDKELLNQLRKEINNKNYNIPSFKIKKFDDDALNFVNFKSNGSFSDLIF